MASTSGPWKAHQDCIIPVIPPHGSPNNNHVILMGGEFLGPDAVWNKALVIASPELLRAVQEARCYVAAATTDDRLCWGSREEASRRLASLDAAISKAGAAS